MYLRKQFLIFFLILINSNIYAQDEIEYSNKIYKENIKTILFHQSGKRFSYPIIDVEKNNSLMLEFDDLNAEETDYSYTIFHCNSDWEPSSLNVIEYIEGFGDDQIEDYENSFNTLVPYKHYKLQFPNENMKPLLSGNYILLVFEGFEKENIVLSRRFFVVDSKVKIEGEIIRSSLVNTMDECQEVRFSITDKTGIIYNPHDNLKITVYQNNIQDIFIKNLKPDFIKSNIYEFVNPGNINFKAGNEYRFFNTKSVKYVNDRIRSIIYDEPYYIFELVTEKSEADNSYSYAQDINGEMLVTVENADNEGLEADYVYVDFKLRYNFPLSTSEFYVFGALSDWNVNKNNRMTYDFGQKSYKLRMLLKQGFYNYQFVKIDNSKSEIDFSLTEGNYYQTENNYVIYVYHKSQGNEYDELIGYKIINSLKKL